MDITMPDFEEWSIRLLEAGENNLDGMEYALKQAFEQGRALGRGEQQEWWEQQDSDYQDNALISLSGNDIINLTKPEDK